MNNKESKEKCKFITNNLQYTLKACGRNVKTAYYQLGTDLEEYCIVEYENGYKKRICISCNSLWATAMDVIRQI